MKKWGTKRVVLLIAVLVSMGFGRANAVEIEYPSIIISEVLPAPDKNFSQVEYIELFNPTDDNFALNGWSIVDLKGDSYSLSGLVIDANDYLVLGGDDFNITLNDNDEKVALVNPSNDIADSIGWESSTKGYSWSLLDGNVWSITTITPNKTNAESSVLKSSSSTAKTTTSQTLTSSDINNMQVKSANKNSSASSTGAKTSKTANSSKISDSNGNNVSSQNGLANQEEPQQASGTGIIDSSISEHNYTVWIVIGALFILYIVYEFRKELRFYYHKFRGKSEIGGENVKIVDRPSYYIVGQ